MILLHQRYIPDSLQLDIEGLNITVTSGDTPSAKGKGKAKAAEGTEILSNATLRLKAGSRYAVVGRNGSGKSSRHSRRGPYSKTV